MEVAVAKEGSVQPESFLSVFHKDVKSAIVEEED